MSAKICGDDCRLPQAEHRFWNFLTYEYEALGLVHNGNTQLSIA